MNVTNEKKRKQCIFTTHKNIGLACFGKFICSLKQNCMTLLWSDEGMRLLAFRLPIFRSAYSAMFVVGH